MNDISDLYNKTHKIEEFISRKKFKRIIRIHLHENIDLEFSENQEFKNLP